MASDYYYREYGRHSGIPECCINFFIEVWCANSQKLYCYSQKISSIKELTYIPCPNCLVNKTFVTTHTCDKSCQGYRNSLEKDVRSEYSL